MDSVDLFAGIIAIFLVAFIIIVVYGIGGAVFALLWNWLMPSLWAAAPVFTWKMGVAAAWLLGLLQGIFGGFRVGKKGD